MQFKGAFTALVTPFSNGQLDEEAYRKLIEWQIQSGINGVVPCGTTGESATMSHDEHKRVTQPITWISIQLRQARAWEFLLLTEPQYMKPRLLICLHRRLRVIKK